MSKENNKPKRKGTNKGGRPIMDKSEVKENFSFRMSKRNLDLLRSKYNNHIGIKESFSEYLRAILLNKEVHIVYHDKGKLELIRELSTIGNNINQIAKYLNQKGDIQKVNIHFEKLSQALINLNEKMYKNENE